jgi:hypothetical protein
MAGVTPALAAPSGVRQLEPHVHGVGHLSFVADGASLVVEIETPLANLVGFEHAPANEAERQAYRDAVAWLSEPEQAVDLSRANCEIVGVDVSEPDLFGDDAEHDHDHADASQGHDHEQADHGHAELSVEYRFACADLPRLDRIRVGLFERFPGFQKIEAVYVGDRTYSGTLTPSDPALDVRR